MWIRCRHASTGPIYKVEMFGPLVKGCIRARRANTWPQKYAAHWPFEACYRCYKLRDYMQKTWHRNLKACIEQTMLTKKSSAAIWDESCANAGTVLHIYCRRRWPSHRPFLNRGSGILFARLTLNFLVLMLPPPLYNLKLVNIQTSLNANWTK